MQSSRTRGIAAALLAAVTFGLTVPVAKAWFGGINPWLLAGVVYPGSGLGLATWAATQRRAWSVPRNQLPWLAGAVLAGGILAPVLLLVGRIGRAPGAGLSGTASLVVAAVDVAATVSRSASGSPSSVVQEAAPSPAELTASRASRTRCDRSSAGARGASPRSFCSRPCGEGCPAGSACTAAPGRG